MNFFALLILTVGLFLTSIEITPPVGNTAITRWQDNKKTAVSITFDDGSINQFRKAMPILNRLNLPATFFIITGQIPGSKYQGKFIGRPVQTIVEETASHSTDSSNFYERSSAARFLGYTGAAAYHTRAGALYDAGKNEEAYKVIDELYQKVRAKELSLSTPSGSGSTDRITWDEIRTFAAQGHEFASHTVSHPYLCAMDEENIIYEIQKSKEDIFEQLGAKHIFSAEMPYGTENERVMSYAHKVYPSLRNRMPETFLLELNRPSKLYPTQSNKEYVQWQRGAVTNTSMQSMKSWMDTSTANDNIWLVLVIHGVDGIGWEALSSDALEQYFNYIKSKSDQAWVAPFGDVTKYMRERMHAQIISSYKKGKISVKLTHSLDTTLYNLNLSLKTYVPEGWISASVKQGTSNQQIKTMKDQVGNFILYQAKPNAEEILITNR